jgi:hypothetical protein
MLNSLRNRLILGTVAAAFAASILVPAAAGPVAAGPEVVVVNTTSQPVPVAVQGTAAVTGSVSILGTPTVAVGNVPTVVVGNSVSQPLPMRDVDLDVRRAIQIEGEVELAANDQIASAPIYSVPAGKRLVIEFVTALGPSDHTISLRIQTTLGDNTMEHHLNFPRADYPRVTSPVRIYADEMTDVVGVLYVFPVLAVPSHALFTLSGYLVDIP